MNPIAADSPKRRFQTVNEKLKNAGAAAFLAFLYICGWYSLHFIGHVCRDLCQCGRRGQRQIAQMCELHPLRFQTAGILFLVCCLIAAGNVLESML